MATLFAPPELISAYSYAVDGSDPDLAKGTYVRVYAGLGASFPLTPFALFKLTARQSEAHGLHVTDRAGNLAGGLFLSQLGLADVIPMLGDTPTTRTVRVDLLPDAEDRLRRAVLLDQSSRVICERRRPPFLFSAPRLHRFRLEGSASFVNVLTKVVDIADIVSRRLPLAADRILGLPVQGLHPWYVGLHNRQDAVARVAAGAPLRLNPMDRPEGPFDATAPEDEVARVEAMLKASQFAGGLEAMLLNLVDDREKAPWLQSERQRMATGTPRVDQVADVPRLAHLQTAAIDPGLARFLGFSDRIDDLPDFRGGGWNALGIAGLFAIDPKRFDPDGMLGIAEVDPNEDGLTRLILRALVAQGGDEVVGQVEELVALVRAQGLLVRAMIAVTAPTPPWLAPSLPSPLVTEHRWQTGNGVEPSSRYRASFAFHDAPLATMAALSARIDGILQSRHGMVETADDAFPERATPRVFGREQSAWASTRALKLPKAPAHHAGLLADHDLPSEAGTISYNCRASDLFGRFGDAVEFDIGPPARPAPPPPVLRFHIDRADVDPASLDALSPGRLKLVFAVPDLPPAARFAAAESDRLASAMVVPALSDLAAGSLTITQATVALDGVSQTVDLTMPGFVEVALALPALAPQEARMLTLSASFTDTGGVASAAATQAVKITDMRPPRVIETGIGLFWTSAPGPSPEVELRLAWPGTPNARYRVYATDQQGLGLTAAELAEAVPGAAPSRGRVAEVGCNKVLGGAPVNRANFRLLSATPVEAGPDGRAVLKTTLARSLQTVQFLRVVPLSPENAEAPFDACGIVPVAVPDSRSPPPPRLEGVVDPVSGVATLTVTADGFDGVGLRRDEPALFGAAGDVGAAPEFRIRRAVGPIADPIYGRPLAAGSLELKAEADPAVLFAASATDDNGGRGLEPYVRYVYWADVRLPPERRLPAGVVPIDPPGGIATVDPANAANHPRPMSLPSAPRVLVHVPPDPPAALEDAAIVVTRAVPAGDGTVALDIAITDPPIAHPKAIGPYRLAVWSQWTDQPITAIKIADGAPLDGAWPDLTNGVISTVIAPPLPPVDPRSALSLTVALVDPAGRLGALATKMIL